MAWNEPGKDDKDSKDKNDPWGNGQGNESPPDLDEVIKNLQKKFGGLFGGKNSNGSSDGGQGGQGNNNAGIFVFIGLLGLLYIAMNSFYVIDASQRGVVLRFGEYVDTLEPGFRVRWPQPIEKVIKVNVTNINDLTSKDSMLTKDENIVDIELTVQYKIKEIKDYIFNVRNPDTTLYQATEAAIRYVIGHSEMDFVLTEGRTQIAEDTKVLIQQTVDRYETGLQVTSVNMKTAKPPEEVKSAFDDINRASEDRQRLINEAQAYEKEIIPKSKGKSTRLIEDASAYAARVIAQAEGQASRFDQLLTQYKLAPEVTRERLYIDSVESVLARNKKIFMDSGKGDNILYLPLGQGSPSQMPNPIPNSAINRPSLSTPNSTSESVDEAVYGGSDSRARSTH